MLCHPFWQSPGQGLPMFTVVPAEQYVVLLFAIADLGKDRTGLWHGHFLFSKGAQLWIFLVFYKGLDLRTRKHSKPQPEVQQGSTGILSLP